MEHIRFWNVLELVRISGQSIIFTSKSAAECELTDKLVILGKGDIQAVGSPNEIYKKYTKGKDTHKS